MDRVEPPEGCAEHVESSKGYVVNDRQGVQKILAVEADLLRGEGIDPAWPGFPEDHEDNNER